MATRSIEQRILEILATGPRKLNVLRFLAEPRRLARAIARLRRGRRIRIVHRNGGPHYAI